MLREEIQKEIKKFNIDSVVRSDVQKYQRGEEQMVLTPELFEAMIASSMEKIMDKYDDGLQEKVDKLNKLLQQKPTKMNERQIVMDRYNDQLQEKLEKNEEKIKQGKRDRYNDHLQKYALPPSILYGTLCEFLFLSVHISFISNNLSFTPILIILLIY